MSRCSQSVLMLHDGVTLMPRWAAETFGEMWRARHGCTSVHNQGQRDAEASEAIRAARQRIWQFIGPSSNSNRGRFVQSVSGDSVYCSGDAMFWEAQGIHTDDVIAHDCEHTRSRHFDCPSRLAVRRQSGCALFSEL